MKVHSEIIINNEKSLKRLTPIPSQTYAQKRLRSHQDKENQREKEVLGQYEHTKELNQQFQKVKEEVKNLRKVDGKLLHLVKKKSMLYLLRSHDPKIKCILSGNASHY